MNDLAMFWGMNAQNNRTPPPAVIAGLSIWLDGTDPKSMTFDSSNRLSQWNDKSGNGVTFFNTNGDNTRPIYDPTLFGNLGGVSFLTVENRFIAPNVNETSGIEVGHMTFIFIGELTTCLWGSMVRDQYAGYSYGSGTNNRLGAVSYAQAFKGRPINTLVMEGIVLTSDSSTRFILNGASLAFQGEPFSGTQQIYQLSLGGNPDAGTLSMNCQQMLVYNRPLLDSEISLLWRWAQTRCKVPPSPINSAYNLLFDGDSITYGYNDIGDAFPTLTANATGLTDWGFQLMATSGNRITDCIARAPTYIDPLYNGSLESGGNMLTFLCGTNDLMFDSISTEDLQTIYQEYCVARQAVGWNLVSATMLPRTVLGGQNENFESQRQAFNAWLRLNYSNFSNALADIGGDPTIGVAGANTNLAYYQDGIHPTLAGHAIIAPYFTNAILAIIPALPL